MEVNDRPRFVREALVESVLISAANPNLDGTGTIVDVVDNSAGTEKVRVDKILFKALAVTTAGMIRIFHHDGAAYFLIAEVPVTVVNPTPSLPSFSAEYLLSDSAENVPFDLPAGNKIGLSTEQAESFHCSAIGGTF